MAKYLILWEIDDTKIPVDPKERGAGWATLMKMTKKDRKKGLTKDWGVFVGETNGYSVFQGSELEVMNTLHQYVPFVKFKVHPVATESQVNRMIKSLTG